MSYMPDTWMYSLVYILMIIAVPVGVYFLIKHIIDKNDKKTNA